MGVQKNVHIENWAGFRENCEHVFRFSRGNIAKFLAFGVGVPLALYYGIVTDMVRLLMIKSASYSFLQSIIQITDHLR